MQFIKQFIYANFNLIISINQKVLLILLIDEGSEAQKGQRMLFRHIKRTSQSLKPQFYKKKKSEFKPQFYLKSKPMFFPLTLQPLVKATQVQVFLSVLCSKQCSFHLPKGRIDHAWEDRLCRCIPGVKTRSELYQPSEPTRIISSLMSQFYL